MLHWQKHVHGTNCQDKMFAHAHEMDCHEFQQFGECFPMHSKLCHTTDAVQRPVQVQARLGRQNRCLRAGKREPEGTAETESEAFAKLASDTAQGKVGTAAFLRLHTTALEFDAHHRDEVLLMAETSLQKVGMYKHSNTSLQTDYETCMD